ncbi:MAG: hydrogenase maturation nickel metallochaperone HypA [Pseudonocardia sp.]|jgi:hydrogenase nickel incorporation protein HypA/HybF|nr:hydrogenase maturation nickel metallochaperone HypA [Pseudonocardia sp.]
MHELAITESIVAAVTEKLPGAPIRRVCVEVGELSGVVPDALRFCFELACAGTTLEGASLDIVRMPGRGQCQSCSAEFDTTDFLVLCACGSAEVTVLGGRELRIREVEVV